MTSLIHTSKTEPNHTMSKTTSDLVKQFASNRDTANRRVANRKYSTYTPFALFLYIVIQKVLYGRKVSNTYLAYFFKLFLTKFAKSLFIS